MREICLLLRPLKYHQGKVVESQRLKWRCPKTGLSCSGKKDVETREEELSKHSTESTEWWEVVKSPIRSQNRGSTDVGVENIVSFSRFASLAEEEVIEAIELVDENNNSQVLVMEIKGSQDKEGKVAQDERVVEEKEEKKDSKESTVKTGGRISLPRESKSVRNLDRPGT